MPTSVHVDELKINKLTEAQYDAAVQAGLIGENELSILTDAASGGQTIQYDTMPTASASNEGDIVQFVGTSDANYTNGYFYQCVSDGAVTPTYSWVAKNVQAGGGGSSYTAGTGVDITSDVISVTDPTLINTAASRIESLAISGSTNNNFSTCVGVYAEANGNSSVAFGNYARSKGEDSVCIGRYSEIVVDGVNGKDGIAIGHTAKAGAKGAIQIGNKGTNSSAGTVQFTLTTNGSTYTNYRLLDSDGTIPEARLADTTNAAQGQVLTLDSNNNAVWATPSASVSTVSGTLLSGSTAWGSGTDTQTLTVQGVTSSNTVIVSPTPLSSTDYADAGIICTAQSTNQLTFTCVTVPTNNIELSIVILG